MILKHILGLLLRNVHCKKNTPNKVYSKYFYQQVSSDMSVNMLMNL